VSICKEMKFVDNFSGLNSYENKTENPNWPVFQLAYGFLPEPVTTLKEVKPLPKGFFLKINLDTGEESLQSFTHYSYSHTLSNAQTARNKIEKKLTDAVGRHLLADAPIGVFLSGGIDSGIITMLASLYHKGNLQTLSLYFNEILYSE